MREIRIGWFGPSDPADPRGGDMWQAATMAVEQANRAGGWRGRPFRLVPGWSANPWGSGVVQVTRMAYDERVWAIVGGIDGASTHLAEQIVAKARLPLVSPASSDKTVNLANVPWMFSVMPDDAVLAGVLAEMLPGRAAGDGFLLVSATDHDSRMLASELEKYLARHRLVPRYHFRVPPGAGTATAVAERVVGAGPGAVVVIAGAAESARLVLAVREAGFGGSILGGPAMGRRAFLEAAGPAGEGVVFPLLFDPRPAQAFARAFEKRCGHGPDYAAAGAYDAVRLLMGAIRRAGLNRARIRDALAAVADWHGAAGPVRWDGLGRNRRAVSPGTIAHGRVTALRRRAARGRPCPSPR